MPYLIDSDVIIWALRGRRDTIYLLSNLAEEESLACSVINVLEVELGAKPSEMKAVREHLNTYEILPALASTAHMAAELIRTHYRKPHRGEWADAAIAATAIMHGLTLVTYNVRHYPYDDISIYQIEN